MEKRREQRSSTNVPVTIRGIDRTGLLFKLEVTTVDIGGAGARLDGVMSRLEPGANIAVQFAGRKALFRVAWIGIPGTPFESQIGVQCIEPSKFLFQPVLTFSLAEAQPPQVIPPAVLQNMSKPEPAPALALPAPLHPPQH